jgi:hypothetical protein
VLGIQQEWRAAEGEEERNGFAGAGLDVRREQAHSELGTAASYRGQTALCAASQIRTLLGLRTYTVGAVSIVPLPLGGSSGDKAAT